MILPENKGWINQLENKEKIGKVENRSLHNDIPIRRKNYPPNQIFLKEKYTEEHLSCQSIADILGGITRQGIWKALKRNGIKIRSKEDAIFYDENGNLCKISQGYFRIYNPDHNRANGIYVKRCVLVLEEKLGRKLEDGEFPHHEDLNRLNDDPDNLSVTNRSKHFATHFLLNPKEARLKDLKKKAKKLCGEDVLKIRSMRNDGIKMQEIANYFSVGRTAIHDVIYGKCWKYINGLIFSILSFYRNL